MLGGRRTRGDHPNYYIIENGQNTEKSPGDLRRLTVTQTLVKNNHLKLVGKSIKEKIIIINMSRCQQGSPRLSLATRLYRPLFPGGLQSYVPYRHKAVVFRFQLVVLPLVVHVAGPQDYVAYELVLTSPAVCHMSGLSNLDCFRDRWWMPM